MGDQLISDVLRQAAREAGGIRPLARGAEIDHVTLIRFLGGRPIRSDQLDKLARALDMELRQRRRQKR